MIKRAGSYIGADMNAKLTEPGDTPEDGVGQYIFGTDGTTDVQEGAGVEENRHLVQDSLNSTRTVLTNTFFRKQPENQFTYRMDQTARTEPPFAEGRFKVIDYIIVQALAQLRQQRLQRLILRHW